MSSTVASSQAAEAINGSADVGITIQDVEMTVRFLCDADGAKGKKRRIVGANDFVSAFSLLDYDSFVMIIDFSVFICRFSCQCVDLDVFQLATLGKSPLFFSRTVGFLHYVFACPPPFTFF